SPHGGEANPEGVRVCLRCATRLAPVAPPSGEVRKTVTVLFADIVSSTSRGEQTGPESTRRMLARYFDTMRRVIERHEGTVEKFIGDAVVMAARIHDLLAAGPPTAASASPGASTVGTPGASSSQASE